MPELPEVETVRTSLEPVLVGRTFERVEIDDERLTRPFDPELVARELQGERVAAVERRGKYLIVRFESGRVLLVHLRMTGSFRHTPAGEPFAPHTRAVVTLDDGSQSSIATCGASARGSSSNRLSWTRTSRRGSAKSRSRADSDRRRSRHGSRNVARR